jgi:hypothetical protein
MISCFKELWLVFSKGYDSLSREFERTSLKGELKKQKQAVAEKMLSAGIGDEGTRKLLLDKTNALKQAIANQAPSSEKASIEKDRKELIETFFSKSIDTFPTSDDAVLEFQKAKQSLDTSEKSVASASASQIPIKKGKAALGFFMVFLAFGFVAGEKDLKPSGQSTTNGRESGKMKEYVSEEAILRTAKAIAAQVGTDQDRTLAMLKRWQKDFNLAQFEVSAVGRTIWNIGLDTGVRGETVLLAVEQTRQSLYNKHTEFSSDVMDEFENTIKLNMVLAKGR